ncbi:MAG: hypothetical protein ACRDSZ_00385 [Pseudonocardiaceae bacterium]
MHTIAQFRSFDRPVQLLLLNQFSINIGFTCSSRISGVPGG